MAILSSDHVKMTSILEKVVAIIAPHRCIICGDYNNMLCKTCVYDAPAIEVVQCVLCGKPTVDWRVCAPCAPLTYIWPFAAYEEPVKTVIAALKFKHARAAAEPLAACLDRVLPYLDDSWVIVPIPTASARIRQRGYDQAKLLARALAAKRKIPCQYLLTRQSDARQVGANRQTRQAQADHLFTAVAATGKKVLLIDDVCTTGATLKAAATALRTVGAQEVAAAVVAWKT